MNCINMSAGKQTFRIKPTFTPCVTGWSVALDEADCRAKSLDQKNMAVSQKE